MDRLNCFVAVVGITMVCNGERSLERKDIVDKINRNPESNWKAALNFDPTVKISYKKSLLGVTTNAYMPFDEMDLNKERYENPKSDIPVTFDARDWKNTRYYVLTTTKWTEVNRQDCTKWIKHVYDQGHCGSSWAIAAASVFSDRRCIYRGTKDDPIDNYSAQDILSCFTDKENAKGCDGGDPKLALEKYSLESTSTINTGLVLEKCRKYIMPPCNHSPSLPRFNQTCLKPHQTQKCIPDFPMCEDSAGDVKRDSAVKLISIRSNTKNMQREIWSFGPLIATFEVYEDFLSYHSGVYHHLEGELLGNHAVKVIGWGKENDTDYWLAINSWGKGWGDRGTFKIKRGDAECHFDNSMVGVDFFKKT